MADASVSLAALQAPAAVSQAQTMLSVAFKRTSVAYMQLALAAGTGSNSRYLAARARVYTAEAGIEASLRGFALLGYEKT
jgi:hypothetical protein